MQVGHNNIATYVLLLRTYVMHSHVAIDLGLSQLCQHNFEDNRVAKAFSIMSA